MKETKEGDKPQNESLTVEQKLRQKKMFIFPLMFIIFGLIMWYIFSPSKSEKEKVTKGFNTTIPMPKNNVLAGDKKTAFEQAKMEENQGEQKHSLQSMASMFSEELKSSDANKLNNENLNNETESTINTSSGRVA